MNSEPIEPRLFLQLPGAAHVLVRETDEVYYTACGLMTAAGTRTDAPPARLCRHCRQSTGPITESVIPAVTDRSSRPPAGIQSVLSF